MQCVETKTEDIGTSRSLQWTVRLSEGQGSKVFMVLFLALVAGSVGLYAMGNPVLALIGILMILGPSSEFLLPIRYSVSEKGASARWGVNVTSISWPEVKRILRGDHAIKLTPLEKPSRLEAFRGVTLRFANNRQEVEEAVQYWYGSYESVG